jgi:hypothetical protein
VLGSLAPLVLAGCSTVARATVVPDHASIERIDAHGVALAVTLVVTNRGTEGGFVREIAAHVVLDRHFDVGTISLQRSTALPRGKPIEMTVPISVKWGDVAPLIVLAASDRSVPYAVDGTVSIGGAIVHFEVPYRLQGSLTHEQILRATRRSLPGLSTP